MRFNMRRVVLAAGLCLCQVVFAGVNTWSALGPYGGQIQRIVYAASAPSKAYMVSIAGFSSSQDGGVTWQSIPVAPQTYLQDVAVDPTDATRVYVVGLYPPYLQISTDGGATLSTVTSFPATLSLASQVQVSSDGATVCVSALLSIACSTDHGHTWGVRAAIPGPANGRILKLLIDPTNSNTFYASVVLSGNDDGIFVTHDGAKTWQQTFASDATSAATDLALAPGNPSTLWAARPGNGVWFSTDGGVTWTSSGTSTIKFGASAVAVSPSNPAVIYAGDPSSEVFSSSNGGATWVNVTGNNGSGQVFTLAISPTQPTTVLAGGYASVFGSVTGGVTWADQSTGVIGTDVMGLSADPTSDRIYLNLNYGGGGLYCVVNGADTVTTLNNSALQQVGSVASPLDVRAVLAQAGSPGSLFASIDTGVAESSDGGKSWTLLPSSQSVADASLFASSPAAPSTILASQFEGRLFRTMDGGNSWSAITAAIPATSYFGRLVVANSDATIAYGAPQAVGPVVAGNTSTLHFGVYRSTNGGQTWSPANAGMQTVPIFGIAVDPTNSQLVYVSTDTASFKSVDGGTSWTQLAGYGGGPISIDPVHVQTLYVSGAADIMRSIDGGTSWEAIPMPQSLSQSAINALLVDPNRTSDLLVATNGVGVQRITIAPDVALQGPATATSVVVGTATTYSYTVVNNGPYSASGVQVGLQLPASAQAITARSTLGTCTVSGTTATCSIGALRVAASATISLTATASAAGAFQISGSAHADEPDSNTVNNAITTTATVAAAGSTGGTSGSSGSGASASSESHGGGGTLTLPWLLGLAALLAVKMVARDSHNTRVVSNDGTRWPNRGMARVKRRRSIAGGAGWSKNGMGKSRRSSSDASMPARF
ncbi:MAG: hypothetical protein JWM63_3409 [Gammaproteobacteria bacterium]|nr:hypothetical protein [Gammaproteobacteria bacterium]